MSSAGTMSKPYRLLQLRWARLKHRAKWRLKQLPSIEPLAIRIWRTGRHIFYKCKWELAALTGMLRGSYARGVDVDKVCWVSPKAIVYRTSKPLRARDFKGHVIAGDWDCLDKRFEDLDEYVALRQVCIEGRDWSETAFYQRRLDRLDRGEIFWYARDKSELDQRCKDRESLFETIRREGYMSQAELLLSQHTNDPVQAADEVTVSIGRHGDLLLSEGRHRLAIAKLLHIEAVPVRIAARHTEWMRFRQELMLFAEANGGRLPQPVSHPDLEDIPASRDCEGTFGLIKDSMSARQGRLLDIGAGLGYYCHRFEDEGFECYAAEVVPDDLYFLRALRRAENKRFKVIAEPALECGEIRNTRFDVVLALNIFHQFLKTEQTYHKLLELLKNLQTRELFFELHLPGESEARDAYKDYTPAELVALLLERSNLGRAESIGVANGGIPLYRLC